MKAHTKNTFCFRVGAIALGILTAAWTTQANDSIQLGSETQANHSGSDVTLETGIVRVTSDLRRFGRRSGIDVSFAGAPMIAEVKGTALLAYKPGGFIQIATLEGRVTLTRTGKLGERIAIDGGKMALTPPDAERLPQVVDIDLSRLLNSSPLLDNWESSAGSKGISRAVAKQASNPNLQMTPLYFDGAGTVARVGGKASEPSSYGSSSDDSRVVVIDNASSDVERLPGPPAGGGVNNIQPILLAGNTNNNVGGGGGGGGGGGLPMLPDQIPDPPRVLPPGNDMIAGSPFGPRSGDGISGGAINGTQNNESVLPRDFREKLDDLDPDNLPSILGIYDVYIAEFEGQIWVPTNPPAGFPEINTEGATLDPSKVGVLVDAYEYGPTNGREVENQAGEVKNQRTDGVFIVEYDRVTGQETYFRFQPEEGASQQFRLQLASGVENPSSLLGTPVLEKLFRDEVGTGVAPPNFVDSVQASADFGTLIIPSAGLVISAPSAFASNPGNNNSVLIDPTSGPLFVSIGAPENATDLRFEPGEVNAFSFVPTGSESDAPVLLSSAGQVTMDGAKLDVPGFEFRGANASAGSRFDIVRGTIKTAGDFRVEVAEKIDIADSTISSDGNLILIGKEITVRNSTQLKAMAELLAQSDGTGDLVINTPGKMHEASVIEFDNFHNITFGSDTMFKATDAFKARTLGADGVLEINSSTIEAGNILRLYAGGANGAVLFKGNVSLNGADAQVDIAGNRVEVENSGKVDIQSSNARVWANQHNYNRPGFGEINSGGTRLDESKRGNFSGRPGFQSGRGR